MDELRLKNSLSMGKEERQGIVGEAVYRSSKQLEFSLNGPLSVRAREEGRILWSRL